MFQFPKVSLAGSLFLTIATLFYSPLLHAQAPKVVQITEAVVEPASDEAVAVARVGEDRSADSEEKWISLFNGKDLEGWIPKIRHLELGKDPGRTFRVEDGLMKVRYEPEQYPEFNETFGHIFYKQPFSNYRLRVEYRFVGDQCKGGPGWAFRNSGLMLHCEAPEEMTVDQDFPASIEYQILGGNGSDPRTNANLCTPGTNVVMDGKLVRQHCTSSTSKTYHGDQWVTVEVEVRGGKTITHTIDGQVVLSYSEPQLDDRDPHAQKLAEKQGGLLLEKGYISLQSESHPIDFRKVELLVLEEE